METMTEEEYKAKFTPQELADNKKRINVIINRLYAQSKGLLYKCGDTYEPEFIVSDTIVGEIKQVDDLTTFLQKNPQLYKEVTIKREKYLAEKHKLQHWGQTLGMIQ